MELGERKTPKSKLKISCSKLCSSLLLSSLHQSRRDRLSIFDQVGIHSLKDALPYKHKCPTWQPLSSFYTYTLQARLDSHWTQFCISLLLCLTPVRSCHPLPILETTCLVGVWMGSSGQQEMTSVIMNCTIFLFHRFQESIKGFKADECMIEMVFGIHFQWSAGGTGHEVGVCRQSYQEKKN